VRRSRRRRSHRFGAGTKTTPTITRTAATCSPRWRTWRWRAASSSWWYRTAHCCGTAFMRRHSSPPSSWYDSPFPSLLHPLCPPNISAAYEAQHLPVTFPVSNSSFWRSGRRSSWSVEQSGHGLTWATWIGSSARSATCTTFASGLARAKQYA